MKTGVEQFDSLKWNFCKVCGLGNELDQTTCVFCHNELEPQIVKHCGCVEDCKCEEL